MTKVSSEKQKMILIGHGSRSAEWRKPLDARVNDLQSIVGEEKVGVAFMELNHPTLAEAIDDGLKEDVTSFWVLPMFLSSGGHVKRDIETEIERLRAVHPRVTIHLMASFGEQPLITNALRALVKQQLQQ